MMSTLMPCFGRAPGAVAEESAADIRALVRTVIALSGIQEQFQQVPAVIEDQLEQHRASLSAQGFERLRGILLEAFQGPLLYDAVVRRFHEEGEIGQLQAARDWLQSAPAARMTDLEARARLAHAQEEFAQLAEQLRTDPPEAERAALLERLDRARNITASRLQTELAVDRALSAALPRSESSGDAERYARVHAQQAEHSRRSQAKALLAFESASLEDLKAYADLWESESGRRLASLGSRALTQALAEASVRASAAVAEEPLLKR